MDTVAGVGADLVDVTRINRWAERYDRDTLRMVFSERELVEAGMHVAPGIRLAASFAIQEAVGKAFGTGLASLRWSDITLRTVPVLAIELEATAARMADQLKIDHWQLEVTQRPQYVWARVIALRGANTAPPESAFGTGFVTQVSLLSYAPAERALADHGSRWLERVLTPVELGYVLEHPHPAQAATARVAARRAVRAAVRAWPRTPRPRAWAQVRSTVGERPLLELSAAAQLLVERSGLSPAGLSLTHAAGHAVAFVVFERVPEPVSGGTRRSPVSYLGSSALSPLINVLFLIFVLSIKKINLEVDFCKFEQHMWVVSLNIG